MDHFDFAIIGAGIAGASLAYELGSSSRVMLLERESFPGYHATGRSAALFAERYGNSIVRAITAASRPFFDQPPENFSAHPLLTQRGRLLIARADQLEKLSADHTADAKNNIHALSGKEACQMLPLLRGGYVAGAIFDPGAKDIDVHGLHQGFLRGKQAKSAAMLTGTEVVGLEFQNGAWHVELGADSVTATVVVNAAGAWAERIGKLASATKMGLRPLRRTAVLVDPPAKAVIDNWPFVVDVDQKFYFKPDAGKLLLSPADETESEPCDARPDELDIAIAVGSSITPNLHWPDSTQCLD